MPDSKTNLKSWQNQAFISTDKVDRILETPRKIHWKELNLLTLAES